MLGVSAGNEDVYPYKLRFGNIDNIDLSSMYRMTVNMLVPSTVVEYPVGVTYPRIADLADPVFADTYRDIVTITISVS
jgi:hypothetical protein